MNKNFKVQAQGGFTLIELIVVIVILGILAATALPKFSDLSGDARTAKLQAAKASVASVSAMAHGKFLVANAGSSVTMEGTTVNLTNGYPTAETNLATAAGLDSTNDYDVSANAANSVLTVSPKGVTTASKCKFTYSNATTSAPPSIAVDVSNCN
jgi:MSHA pilin protein MshA